ncbi:MAG: tetratricopeptide repeat protein [Salinivirgaceae bacterium]
MVGLRILLSVFIVMHLAPRLFGQDLAEKLIQEVQTYRAANNQQQAAATLNKLAFYYWEQEKHPKAIQAFEQSVAINKELGNENAIKAIYSNMGMIHSDLGQPETALVFFRKSLLISRNLNQKQDIATNYMNIAGALALLDRNQEAIENLQMALPILVEMNHKKLLRTCYGLLAENFEKIGDNQQSMEYFNLYASFQRQVQKEEVETEKAKSQTMVKQAHKKAEKALQEKQETEVKLTVTQDSLKRAEELNLIKELELEKKQAELKSQQLLTLIFIIGMGFVAILALLILYSYRQKRKHYIILEHRNQEIRMQNQEIQAKNQKINQSINYARNIQGALLPEIDTFTKLFKESFIFFSPRDVVSGDFYWFTEVPGQDHLRIIAAVDCTGHGVPGAFMSMLGMNFLYEIVIDRKITEPKQILEKMHVMIKKSLKQENTGNSDGMDIALCTYNQKEKSLTFAGAVNPLIYIQDGVMQSIKGDFFGVGGQMKGEGSTERFFTQTTIDVSKPTTCYLCSDGFADQFGGEKGKKYFMKNFRELLLNIHTQAMHEQATTLEQTLLAWHGQKYPRLDDVLVMGFKI